MKGSPCFRCRFHRKTGGIREIMRICVLCKILSTIKKNLRGLRSWLHKMHNNHNYAAALGTG